MFVIAIQSLDANNPHFVASLPHFLLFPFIIEDFYCDNKVNTN